MKRGPKPKPEAERLQPLTASVYPHDYDELCRVAMRHDRTVSFVVRVAIRRWLEQRQEVGA